MVWFCICYYWFSDSTPLQGSWLDRDSTLINNSQANKTFTKDSDHASCVDPQATASLIKSAVIVKDSPLIQSMKKDEKENVGRFVKELKEYYYVHRTCICHFHTETHPILQLVMWPRIREDDWKYMSIVYSTYQYTIVHKYTCLHVHVYSYSTFII